MKKLLKGLLTFAVFLQILGLGFIAHATPLTFTYQGRIVGTEGPLEYQSVSFEFAITNPDGSCILYREQKNGVDMRNSKGIFDTPIGAGSKQYPLSSTFTLLSAFVNSGTLNCEGGGTYAPATDDVRRLRVQFFDGTGWRLISPDNIIRTVPFAGYAQNAATAAKLGTNVVADFQLKNDIPVCNGSDVLTSNSTGVLTCVANAGGGGGSGTVTSVATGTGLTGGPITTTGTISIATGGVGATQLASDAVTTVKILDGNVTGAKLETIGGLTAGTYGSATAVPAVTIDAKGRVTAITTNSISGLLPAAAGASGKYLKSDGTSWAGADVKFSDIKNAAGTSAFNTGSCAANQTVNWSSLTDMFECQNIGSLAAGAITSGTIATARLGSGTADNTTYLRGDGTWATVIAGTGDFKADGTVAMTGVFRAATGNGTTPSITFASDTATGFYSVATNTVGFITNNVERYRFSSASIASQTNYAAHISMGGTSATSPPLSFANDTDTGVYRSAANTVALTAGGVRAFEANTTASAVNYIAVTPAATGDSPVISAAGSDTNVNLTFTPKGSGDSIFSSRVRATHICANDGSNCKDLTTSWGSGGSVTSIVAGTGLDGGTITTSGTISIANGGVTATQLASDAVSTVKILDGNVTGAKLEDVSGLTAGSYGSATAIPAITVDAKGRVTAVSTNSITGLPSAAGASGKYLKSDGTNWAGADVKFSDIKNGVGASAFNTGSCAANQTVKWSSLTDMFECQDIGSLNASVITAGTIDSARLPASASYWQDGGASKIYYNAGNVGIGTSNPGVKLEVNGDMTASSISANFYDNTSSSTINFANGNVQTTSYDCGSALTLSNMRDGGSYTLIITGTGTTACTFSHTGVTGWRFSPSNTTRTASSHTVYTMLKAGSTVYISWISGFVP